ncbi:hypothetical protein PFISCL1PPCAC_11954, partial [Pristionchus fissidentatus]
NTFPDKGNTNRLDVFTSRQINQEQFKQGHSEDQLVHPIKLREELSRTKKRKMLGKLLLQNFSKKRKLKLPATDKSQRQIED